MSYRMDNWMANTGVRNNYLVNSTGVNNTGCCGGSNAANTALGIFNVAAGIGMTALAAKAESRATQAQQGTSMNALTAQVTTAMTGFQIAESTYDSSVEQLEALQQQKENTTQEKIDEFEQETNSVKNAEGNKEALAKFEALNTAVSSIKTAVSQAKIQEGIISSNKAAAEAIITPSLSNSKVSIDVDSSTSVTEQVRNQADKYNTGVKDFDINTDEMFKQDLQHAATLDQQISTKRTAQNAITSAEKALAAIKLPNLPDGLSAPSPVTLAGLESLLQQAESQRDLAGSAQLPDSQGTNIVSPAQIKAREQSATKMKANLADPKALDAKIAKQKKTVEANKNALIAKKQDLMKLQAELTNARTQTSQVIQEGTEAANAKSRFNDVKTKNNKDRNFLQKMFGSGKSVERKDSKKFYKAQNAEYKEAQQSFAQSYSFKADAANLAAIDSQLSKVTEMLNKIASIEQDE